MSGAANTARGEDSLRVRGETLVLRPSFAALVAAEGEHDAAVADEPVAQQPVVKSEWEKTPRNAPCPCGSGKKYKQCHGA